MKKLTQLLLPICALPLFIAGCGGGSSEDIPESISLVNANGTPALEDVYAYKDTAIASSALNCSTLFLNSESCDVSDIKPIGANLSTDVSLADIENRLVVSHDWMASSFLAALEEINDQDLLNLFKPINSIVLSYDTRPSFYHSYTASIYIDPRYLWRDSMEWDTIYEQDDYRSSYQTEFTFDSFWRYVDSNTNSYVTWSNSFNSYYNTRTSAQIAPGLFRLLAHELAHANDFLPAELLSSLGSNGEIYSDYISSATHIHDDLNYESPLTSDLLFEAAKIAYQGSDMTDLIRNTSAAEAGNAFKDDGALALYAYSASAEDVAMLFEAFMMYKKYGAIRDVAFVDIPAEESPSCSEYIVKWGQRNRLADSYVKERAILVANMILDRDITLELSSSQAINMEPGIDWCESRYTTTVASEDGASNSLESSSFSMPQQQVIHDYKEDRLIE